MKILVVDDIGANRRLLRATLEAEGHDIVEASDGEAALEKLSHEDVDAVISDILMPNMDGFRLCHEVRKHPRLGPLAFLIYTSTYDSPADAELAKTVGADHYLVKPAPTSALLKALEDAAVRARTRASRVAEPHEEMFVFKKYNAALVLKLEERNIELAKAVEELRANEEQFRQIAEAITGVFWLTDPTGKRALYVSPVYERIWQRPVAELSTEFTAWIDAVVEEDRAGVAEAFARDVPAGSFNKEFRILRGDGTVRWIHARSFPVRDARGNIHRVAGIAEDVTDSRRLEEQFQQAQKMEAIGHLATGVAHDFNNILTAIQLNSSLLGDLESLPAEARAFVGEISTSVERAAGLTRQLLSFGRKQVKEVRTLDLNHAVKEMMTLVSRVIGEQIHLKVELAPEPVTVHADATMIGQVILNLAVNARDAMPRGGKLLIRTADVVARNPAGTERAAGRFARLSVIDDGEGMSPEVKSRVFEPFFTTKEPGRGTGLGLATVRSIVQQHRGWIDLESSLGNGASFHIHLPRVDVSVGSPREGNGGVAALPAKKSTETVLLVEDDRMLRIPVREVLKRSGYRVLDCATAEEALDEWMKNRDSIQIVMTDIVLTGKVSGVDLAAILTSERPSMPVVFTSGYAPENAIAAIEGSPTARFLPKPYEIPRMLRLLRECLEGTAPGDPLK